MAVIITLGNDKDLVYNSFAAVPEGRRKEWILAVKLQDWVPWKYSRICGDHQVSLQEAKASARLQLCTVSVRYSYKNLFKLTSRLCFRQASGSQRSH